MCPRPLDAWYVIKPCCNICASWDKVAQVCKYRTRDGCWTIEVVRLSLTPNHSDGERIRVRQYGFWVADLRSVEALESYVALAELEEGLKLARCCLYA
jgi:hypothetical protein